LLPSSILSNSKNSSFSFEGSGDGVLLIQSCVQKSASIIWGVREQQYRSRTLPLVKANSKATVETGITSTSLGMLARVGNQPEFSFHQFKTSKSNKLFLASSMYISNSDVLDLVDWKCRL